MPTRNYEYTVDERGMSFPEDTFKFSSRFDPDDPEWLAEDAAEHFHRNHDGWEASWPVTIEVFHDGLFLGRFEVDREAVPSFNATRVKVDGREPGKGESRG